MFWSRFRKDKTATEQELDPQEAVNDQRALQRLSRVVERRKDEAEAARQAADAHGQQLQRLLGGNAFCVLAVPMDADMPTLIAAADDLAFSEELDPQAVEAARAQLLAPRDRLAHELAWLPATTPDQQARMRAALKQGDHGEIGAIRYGTSGLARINLGAALIEAGITDARLVRSVLDDVMAWDEHECRDRIDEARLRAGQRESDPDHFADAIAARRRAIAASLAQGLAEQRDGRALLAEFFTAQAEAVRSARAPLLDDLAKAYERQVSARLQQVSNGITANIARLREAPLAGSVIGSICTSLDLWSQLRLPIQRLEEARGLDDLASADLMLEIRSLAIDLANQYNQFDDCMRLVKALRVCCAAVPALRSRVEGDLHTIMGNLVSKRFDDAAAHAVLHAAKFAREAEAQGFDTEQPGMVRRVMDAFHDLVEHLGESDQHPWIALFNFAIALHSDGGQGGATLKLLQWMKLQVLPVEVDRHVREILARAGRG